MHQYTTLETKHRAEIGEGETSGQRAPPCRRTINSTAQTENKPGFNTLANNTKTQNRRKQKGYNTKGCWGWRHQQPHPRFLLLSFPPSPALYMPPDAPLTDWLKRWLGLGQFICFSLTWIRALYKHWICPPHSAQWKQQLLDKWFIRRV